MLTRFWFVLTFAALSVGSFAQQTVAVKGAKDKAMYDLIGDVKMVVCSPYNNFGIDTLHFNVDGNYLIDSTLDVSLDSDEAGVDMVSGKPSSRRVLFAKSY